MVSVLFALLATCSRVGAYDSIELVQTKVSGGQTSPYYYYYSSEKRNAGSPVHQRPVKGQTSPEQADPVEVDQIIQAAVGTVRAGVDAAVTSTNAISTASCPAVRITSEVRGLAASTTFACRVRELPDGPWQEAFVFTSKSGPTWMDKTRGNAYENIQNGYFEALDHWTSSWVSYEVDPGIAVELEVTQLHGEGFVSTAKVHPEHKVDVVQVESGRAHVTVTGPTMFTVAVNGGLDVVNTGNRVYEKTNPAMHTFTVFANPNLGCSSETRPDPSDPNVRTVSPGETPPEDFSEDVLYFLPGVHTLTPYPTCCTTPDRSQACKCEGYNPSAAGYVKPFHPRSGKSYYLPTEAWLDGWIKNEGWGIRDVKIFGYGALSGMKIGYRDFTGDTAPKALQLKGMENCRIEGITLVDHTNHHLILVGGDSKPNSMAWVKVMGWRINGDGFNVMGRWTTVSDMFLRTQDDSMYLGGVTRGPTTISRIMAWNDANGSPFIFSAGNTKGRDVVLEDSDVVYTRKSWPYGHGAMFNLRDTPTSIQNITIRNIRIHDPFPTTPLLYIQGSMKDVSFTNVTMAAHSSYKQLPSWNCFKNPDVRFNLPVSFGCDMPYGIPNRIIGAASYEGVHGGGGHTPGDPLINFTRISFSNVSINGTNLADLLDPSLGAVVAAGHLNDVRVDGKVVFESSHPKGIVDCQGEVGGVAVADFCGTCDDDPTNDCPPPTPAPPDCAGTVGGNAKLDRCGTCDDDPSNDCPAATWAEMQSESCSSPALGQSSMPMCIYRNNTGCAPGCSMDVPDTRGGPAGTKNLFHGGSSCNGGNSMCMCEWNAWTRDHATGQVVGIAGYAPMPPNDDGSYNQDPASCAQACEAHPECNYAVFAGWVGKCFLVRSCVRKTHFVGDRGAVVFERASKVDFD